MEIIYLLTEITKYDFQTFSIHNYQPLKMGRASRLLDMTPLRLEHASGRSQLPRRASPARVILLASAFLLQAKYS